MRPLQKSIRGKLSGHGLMQKQIVAELDAEAAHIEAVRVLIPRSEAKIQRPHARVWGTAT